MNNKLLTIGDPHLGIRKDCKWTYEYQYKALKEITDYARENGIINLLCMGDFFDVRNSISQLTMNRIRTEIMPLFDGLHLFALVGNHDMKHKEKITPNSLDEMLGFYSNVTVINKPTKMDFNGTWVDIIPWICDENREEIMKFIADSKLKYCFGHFELSGYYYYKGVKSTGRSNSFLSGYDKVYSGHYHTISEGDNILYVGTPYTLTAGDANDTRGIWELDVKDMSNPTFIENSNMMHHRINFDADDFDMSTVGEYENKNVIVNVVNRKSSKRNQDIQMLEKALFDIVHGLKINDTVNYDGIDIETENISVRDNKDLAYEYIQKLTEDENIKVLVKDLFNELYLDAIKIKNGAI